MARSENVHVLSVVVTELELGNVERHILGADLVERADHAALHQGPETLNRVGMDGTDNIFMRLVPNGTMRVFGSQLS